MVTCNAFQKVWFRLAGATKLSEGVKGLYFSASQQAVSSTALESCSGAGQYQGPAFESTHPGRQTPALVLECFHYSCTSGKMNCSTGLYHSLFTWTPQLGGLKRATKRASYRLGGKKTRRNTSDQTWHMQQVFKEFTSWSAKFSVAPIMVTSIVQRCFRAYLGFLVRSWIVKKDI